MRLQGPPTPSATPEACLLPNDLHQLDEAKVLQLRSEGLRLTSKLEPQTFQGGVIAALAGTLSGFSLAKLHVLEPTEKLEATAQSISGNPLNILMANKSVFRNEFMMIQDKYLLEFQDLKFLFYQHWESYKN